MGGEQRQGRFGTGPVAQGGGSEGQAAIAVVGHEPQEDGVLAFGGPGP